MSKELIKVSTSTGLGPSSSRLAKPLPPEDIREGMHVMVLAETIECLRWSDGFGTGITKSVVSMTPGNGQRPAEVVSVCLPFVLVKNGKGEPYCYDVRNVRLARVSRALDKGARAIDRAREKSRKKREKAEKRKPRKARSKRKRKR